MTLHESATSTLTLRGHARAGRHGVTGVAVTLADRTGAQVGLTRTDDNGGFEVTGLRAGSYLTVFSHRGFQPHADMVTLDARSTALDVQLTPTTSVRGRVTRWHDGAGAADATVTAVGADGEILTSTVTDADGYYRLTEIHDEHITLVTAASGAHPRATELTCVAGTEHIIELTVDVRSTLAGTVTHAGAPVPHLRLTLRDHHGIPVTATETDATGRYRFDGIDPGRYTVDSAAAGPRGVVVGAGAAEFDIVLYSPAHPDH